MERDGVQQAQPPTRMATQEEMTSLDWVIRQAAHSDARKLEAEINKARARGQTLVEALASYAEGRR